MEENESICWYAARTRYGQELGIKSRLENMGIENFIPTCKRKNYRGKYKEHPVINNLVFIRTSKKLACDLRSFCGLPVNYITDCARHGMLVVPDKQMEDFQRVFEQSLESGGLVDAPLVVGENIRVTEGPLKGVEGSIMELSGNYYVVVSLCGFVYAKASVPRAWLEKI